MFRRTPETSGNTLSETISNQIFVVTIRVNTFEFLSKILGRRGVELLQVVYSGVFFDKNDPGSNYCFTSTTFISLLRNAFSSCEYYERYIISHASNRLIIFRINMYDIYIMRLWKGTFLNEDRSFHTYFTKSAVLKIQTINIDISTIQQAKYRPTRPSWKSS